MNKERYNDLINANKPKEPKLRNAIIAFISGGLLGFFCELLSFLLMIIFKISKVLSYQIICIVLIFLASLITALAIFDNLVTKLKCGLIIPTTGFAHSVTSSMIDYKKDGFITGIGANYFKLAGSVILYGIITSFFLCVLKVIING